MSADLWVIEFDYRADNGPRLVGVFQSKAQALDWLLSLGVDHEANATRLYVVLDHWQITGGGRD